MDSSGIRSTSSFFLSSTQGSSGNAAKDVEEIAAAKGVSAIGAEKDDEKDRLDLPSDSLLEVLNKIDLFGAKPRADGAIHIEDMRENYAERFANFTQKLNGLLKTAGIDRGCEAILRSDGQGKIRVTNNHPDREKIEEFFEDNPELANEFRYLSGTASFLRAADESLKFQAAYAKNPYAAVEQFSHLFDNSNAKDFALRINQDAIMALFV